MREPHFLDRSPFRRGVRLLRDFVLFVQVLLFYVLCHLLGSCTKLIDRVFASRFTDALVRMFELSDEWNHR